jgi:CRP-like cAMP-binding protein
VIGLPATLAKRNYSMTATVTHDAELGFLSTQALESLLLEHPEFCRELRRKRFVDCKVRGSFPLGASARTDQF